MSNEKIIKTYEIKIKQGIDEIIKEYNVTDSAKIERVAQRYKEGFIVSLKKGREEDIEIGEARGKEKSYKMPKDEIDLKHISSVTGFSEDELLKLKSTI